VLQPLSGQQQHQQSLGDVIALLDSSAADDVMSTLAVAADTASHHHHTMTFDPTEPRPHDLHSPVDPKHSTLSLCRQCAAPHTNWVSETPRGLSCFNPTTILLVYCYSSYGYCCKPLLMFSISVVFGDLTGARFLAGVW